MKKIALLLSFVSIIGCKNGVSSSTGTAACATASACGLITGGISSCTLAVQNLNEDAVAAAFKINADQVNCIASAGSNCDLARKCLNNGSTPTACSGTSATCNGDNWSSCDGTTGTDGNNGTRQFNCGSVGESCIVNNGRVDCANATCSGFLFECDNNLLKTCDTDGFEHDQDCAAISSTCVPGTLGGAHCRGNGPGCSGISELRCDGSILVSCTDGQESRFDCGRDHLGCFGPPPSGSGYRCALGADCDPATFGATCEGNTLHFCNKGKLDSVDCGANGFVGCDANNGGVCKTKTP